MISVALPRAFRDDRADRELPVGEVVNTLPGGLLLVQMPESDAREYLSDAEYYGDKYGPDVGVSIGLKSSARASAKRLRAALST
jgi:hypothetical protein